MLADGVQVELGSPQQRALLALLLLNANEVVSRDRIVDELWSRPPATAAKQIQVYVSRLRKVLEPDRATGEDARILVTRSPGYALVVAPDQIDAVRFERLTSEGRDALSSDDPSRAVGLLEDASSLWRGPPLADLAYDSFAQAEIGRLEELRLATAEDRLSAELELGRDTEVIGELEALIAEHPLRERLRGQLMLALYRSGRQADALDAYQRARETLTEELGIEPSRALRDLHGAILRQDPDLDSAPPPRPLPAASRGLFVGRAREQALLSEALDDALAGSGRVALIVGEPGIGKSALAEELMARARVRGAEVIVGRSWEAGGAPPYWPWVQAFRSHVRETEPTALRAQLGAGAPDLAQLVPELRELFPDLPEPATVESEGARFRLFECVGAFVREAARARPIALMLDDLHAADESSLLLLRFLAREIADARVLLVGALRDVDPTIRGAVASTLAELVREPHARQIPLGGLARDDVAEYIEMSSGAQPAARLVEAVHAETGGNPLFVGETVRLFDAEGQIAAPDAEVHIPTGVRAVIDQRVGRLGDGCRRLLTSASVLGREVELDVLAQLSDVSAAELHEALEEAMAERILMDVPGSPDSVRFGHALIRDSLYEELSPLRLRQLHRDAGEALEQVHRNDLTPHLSELAHHFDAAAASEVGGKAAEYARRAADLAASQLAFEEAARLYEIALARVDEPAERGELLLALGETHARAGSSASAKRVFREAAGLAEAEGRPELLARAALGYAGRINWERHLDDEHIVPLFERAIGELGQDDSPLRVRLLARFCSGPLRAARFPRERRLELGAEAVAMARRMNDPASLAYALDSYIATFESPENAVELRTVAEEALRVSTEVGDLERVFQAHEHRLERFFEIGEASRGIAELERMTAIAEELRQPAQRWLVAVIGARLLLEAGRFEEAEGAIGEAREVGIGALSWNAGAGYLVQMFMLRLQQGRFDEAREIVDRAAAEFPDHEMWACSRAHVLALLGEEDEAREALETLAADRFKAVPFTEDAWYVAIGLLGDAAARLGDASAADVLYELLSPYADRVAVAYPELSAGAVAGYLGMLAATAERWDASESHFEAGLQTNERLGARPWLAHTRRDYARMLSARGRRADRTRGRDLIRAARDGYRQMGMDAYAVEAESLDRALSR